MSLFKSVATIGSFTMLSRITGLMREMLIAHFLGAGAVADAFFVAFRFPNLFRSLFAEGAFNAAFVPLFAGKLESEGREAAKLFAERSLAVLFWALAVFIAVMELAMPWAIYLLAPGFENTPGKIEMAAELSRITFPYLLFISMVSLQSGVLNSLGKFAASAATPVLLNLISMALLVALLPYTDTPGHAMAWGTSIAGLCQFLWLVNSTRRAGFPLRPVWPKISPEVKTLLRRIVPGALGAGIYQVNLVINTIIASMVANGAVSYLNYADRINQLPLGVIGFAVGTALLPLLSRQIRAGESDAALHSQNRALEMALLLTVPAALALMVIAHPIVGVLFERGAFGKAETMAVAQALQAFAIGLPAYVLIKVLTPGFFAREDTRTPVRVAVVAMIVNIGLNLALIEPLAHVGMALATAIAAWLNMAILGWLLHKRAFFAIDARLKGKILRILAASIVMALGLVMVQKLLPAMLLDGEARVVGLGILVAAGGGLYAASAVLFGAARPSDLKALRPKRK